jgi:L-amino acid N-acyltransferase YncA
VISTTNPPRSSESVLPVEVSTAGDDAPRLRDGSAIRIRHVTPEDEPALLAFMQRLSPESRRLRFFSPATNLDEAARWAAGADGTDHIGVVALDPREQILAHAACVRMYGPRAEVAVEVDETHRHQGLATILITRLAREAEQQQIRHFVAEVLPDNREMLAVFSDGFDASRHFADGEVDIEFPTSAWQLPPTRLG